MVVFKRGACYTGCAAALLSPPTTPADATVCPIAIKYNKIFVDAFWNSKRQSFTAHLVGGLGWGWMGEWVGVQGGEWVGG